jgi:hypothetical protein
VPLGRDRSRPRCTVHGVAHGLSRRSVRGPRARRWRPCSAGPRNTRWHCPAARGSAAALLGEPATAQHQRTGDGGETVAHQRGDGGVARRRRASGERREMVTDRASAASDRGGRDGGVSEAAVRHGGGAREVVGRRAARARRRSGGRGRGGDCRARRGAVEAAVGTARGFKPLHRRGAWRPHGSGVLPRGPSAGRGV